MATFKRKNRVLFLIGTVISMLFSELVIGILTGTGLVGLTAGGGLTIFGLLAVIWFVVHIVGFVVNGASIVVEPLVDMFGSIRNGMLARRKERKTIKLAHLHEIEIMEIEHKLKLKSLGVEPGQVLTQGVEMIKEEEVKIVEDAIEKPITVKPEVQEVVVEETPEVEFDYKSKKELKQEKKLAKEIERQKIYDEQLRIAQEAIDKQKEEEQPE